MNLGKDRYAFLAILLLIVSAASGCGFMDKLEARDQLNRGVSAYSAKNHEEAIDHFKQAIELDPELIDAYLYLAITYRAQFVPQATNPENLAKARQAIEAFQQVMQHAPNNQQIQETAMANIAGIYSGMNEHEQAKQWYQKRLELDPSNPEPLYGIGTINWQLSYDETGMDGENVEELSEEKKEELNKLLDEGIKALNEALEINPEYVDAMQYLNLLYREKAKLTEDEQKKQEWLKQADSLALQSLELRRKQQERAEKARRQLLTDEKKN